MIAQPAYLGQPTIIYQQPAQEAEPAKPEEPKLTGDPNQEFYCRELDGSWSLRTVTAIEKECRPGTWQTSVSGWPVFYRTGSKVGDDTHSKVTRLIRLIWQD